MPFGPLGANTVTDLTSPVRADAGPNATRRFILILAAAIPACFMLIWTYVALVPAGFMDAGYAVWAAKRAMIDECVAGDVVLLGDSNMAAAVSPGLLNVSTTNLAVINGKTIEAYFALTHILQCPRLPRYILLSISIHEFTNMASFWDSTVKMRFLQAAEITEVEAKSEVLGDTSVTAAPSFLATYPALRAWAYKYHFPIIYGAVLLQSGLVGRLPRNLGNKVEYVVRRGELRFGDDNESDAISVDGQLKTFIPLPILDYYFERILDAAASAGLRVGFVVTPVNDTTARAMPDSVRKTFRDFVQAKTARYPNLDVLAAEREAWPTHYFGDGLGHFNRRGTALFSMRLGACIDSLERLMPQNNPACREIVVRPVD